MTRGPFSFFVKNIDERTMLTHCLCYSSLRRFVSVQFDSPLLSASLLSWNFGIYR